MGARQKRDYAKETASRLQLTDDEELLLEQNLGTFDEVLTRDPNILKLSTIDENLPAESPYYRQYQQFIGARRAAMIERLGILLGVSDADLSG